MFKGLWSLEFPAASTEEITGALQHLAESPGAISQMRGQRIILWSDSFSESSLSAEFVFLHCCAASKRWWSYPQEKEGDMTCESWKPSDAGFLIGIHLTFLPSDLSPPSFKSLWPNHFNQVSSGECFLLYFFGSRMICRHCCPGPGFWESGFPCSFGLSLILFYMPGNVTVGNCCPKSWNLEHHYVMQQCTSMFNIPTPGFNRLWR